VRFDCTAPLVARGPSALVHACCIDSYWKIFIIHRAGFIATTCTARLDPPHRVESGPDEMGPG
jgi:hypothetical protein